jgi:hypothetical protein
MITWSKREIMQVVEACKRDPEYGAWQIEHAIELAAAGELKADWHGKGVLAKWTEKEKSA